MTALEVLTAGPATTVQDLGRPGLAHLGVTRSGAADRRALRLANRLLGNPDGAAGLEVTLGGLAVRCTADADVAVTGAACPVAVDGTPVGRAAVVTVRAGQVLTLGTATAGLRAYVAVRGGLAVPAVLGSRSRDTLAGIGPDAVRAGDVLPVGPSPADLPHVDVAPVAAAPTGEVVLDAVPGPRDDLLPVAVVDRLWAVRWCVDPASDRVGVRLAPPPGDDTEPAHDGAGASEPMVRGAVQVPPSGRPVLFGADHPVTGGYPVAAVLTDAAAARAAQLRPGQPVRLRRASAVRP